MSTRCQIGFYESDEQKLGAPDALLYRHSDGYPEGVIPDIKEYLEWFATMRTTTDVEYKAARLLQYLCNSYDNNTTEDEKNFTGIYGYGISKSFHGDLEYYYAIYADRIDIYEVNYGDADKWRKIKVEKLGKWIGQNMVDLKK